MITHSKEGYLEILGECGSDLLLEKYLVENSECIHKYYDAKLSITINESESIFLNKVDAYALAIRIFKMLEE